MKSALRATAMLSGSSAISIVLSLVTTKVLALELRPAGYGYYGLLQSFVAVGSLVAGMGIATGLVRLGAGPAAEGDHTTIEELRAGAWLLTGILALVIVPILTVFRIPLSRWALGGAEHQGALVLMGAALCFTVGVNVQNGLLNAWHKVEALASYGVVSTMLNGAVSIAAVCIWHAQGIVPAVLGSALANWLLSRYFLWRNVPRDLCSVTLRAALRSAQSLLRFGIPFTASSAVGTGVQLGLPMVVLHLVNTEGVAYYKAAASISVGYLGFLVNAMALDYYPRLSAARGKPLVMVQLVHEQYRLVMLLAVPMILGTLSLVPYLVPIIFSPRFEPTVEILEWQLMGDLFKFSSWTMSFAVLARCKPTAYFMTELLGGTTMLVATWVGVRMFGIAGLGIGFLAAYAIYYLVVRTVLLREVAARETRDNARFFLISLGAAFIIRLLPSTPLAGFRTLVSLLLASGFALYSIRVLWDTYLRAWVLRRKILLASLSDAG